MVLGLQREKSANALNFCSKTGPVIAIVGHCTYLGTIVEWLVAALSARSRFAWRWLGHKSALCSGASGSEPSAEGIRTSHSICIRKVQTPDIREYWLGLCTISPAFSALFFLPPGAALSFFSRKSEKKGRGAHCTASSRRTGKRERIAAPVCALARNDVQRGSGAKRGKRARKKQAAFAACFLHVFGCFSACVRCPPRRRRSGAPSCPRPRRRCP